MLSPAGRRHAGGSEQVPLGTQARNACPRSLPLPAKLVLLEPRFRFVSICHSEVRASRGLAAVCISLRVVSKIGVMLLQQKGGVPET